MMFKEIEKIFNNNKEKVLFYYNLSDAWHFTVQNVLLISTEEHNLFYVDEEDKINKVTVNEEDLNTILDIINNSGILKIKKVKEPGVLDGYFNEFYFSNSDSTNKIVTSNLTYYIDDVDAPDEAKLLIIVFNEIASILERYNVALNLEESSDYFEEDE